MYLLILLNSLQTI